MSNPAPVLVLIHNKHAAAYQGRAQKAVYEAPSTATAEDIERLRLSWEKPDGDDARG